MAVYIEERLCKGCGLCVHFCKHDVLRIGDRRNVKGYNVVEIAQLDRCKFCKLCEMNCPDFALYVEAEKKTKTKTKEKQKAK